MPRVDGYGALCVAAEQRGWRVRLSLRDHKLEALVVLDRAGEALASVAVLDRPIEVVGQIALEELKAEGRC